jgi:hypothetical protein
MFTIVIKLIKTIFKIVITWIIIIESVTLIFFNFYKWYQTAWSQGSSKYRKQKKCTHSEIPINLIFHVYIIPKETNILQIQIKKKENG